MREYDFTGGTVTMTVPYETAQKFIGMLERDFGDELFTLGNEFCVGKDGHTAKYLCVEVDGVSADSPCRNCLEFNCEECNYAKF